MGFNEWIAIFCFILLVLTYLLPLRGIKTITWQEAREKRNEKDVQFVDVRTPGEYNRYALKPFRNIPLYELAHRAPSELDKSKAVVVVCQGGIRSTKAAKVLKRQGFSDIHRIKGGISAWKKHKNTQEPAN